MNRFSFILVALAVCACPGIQAETATPAVSSASATSPSPEPAAESPPAPRADSSLLEPGRVGPIALGSTVEALYDQYGVERLRRIERDEDGTSMPAIALYGDAKKSGEPLVVFGLEEGDILAGAEVHASHFHTPQGIAVGSTVKDLRFTFKAIHPDQVTLQDDGSLGITIEDLRMTFVLDTGVMSEALLQRYERSHNPAIIPNSVPILKILLY